MSRAQPLSLSALGAVALGLLCSVVLVLLDDGNRFRGVVLEYKPNKATLDRMKKLQFGMKQDLPKCFVQHDLTDDQKIDAFNAKRMHEGNETMNIGDREVTGQGQMGEWRYHRGPPYVDRITLFSGPGADLPGSANIVRKLLGIKLGFRGDITSCPDYEYWHDKHPWRYNGVQEGFYVKRQPKSEWDYLHCAKKSPGTCHDNVTCARSMRGKSYIQDFNSAQFRFLYRSACSTIVIPPLHNASASALEGDGVIRMAHFVKDGYNSLIMLGSRDSVTWLNDNVATLDGGFSLEAEVKDGPFEAQEAHQKDTPFKKLAATLPGPGESVTGVKKSSLPANAVSYYEADGVSVLFELPVDQGRILYLGYDYSEALTPWVHALSAATMFQDWPKKKE